MDVIHTTPFLINCLVNESIYVSTLIDTGCLCFAVFDEKLVHNNNFPAHNIVPRSLYLANSNVTELITKVTCVTLNIGGRIQKICGYVVPKLAYPMILGKPWMEQNDITYIAKKRCLKLGSKSHAVVVHEFNPSHYPNSSSNSLLGAASISDIAKSLESKPVADSAEVINSLPAEIRHFGNLFIEDDPALNHELPPHRGSSDTKIVLQRDETGKEKKVPWRPLYGMSRDELLVLRKTLSELIEKI